LAEEVEVPVAGLVHPLEVLSSGHARTGLREHVRGDIERPLGEFHGVAGNPEPRVLHQVSAQQIS